MRASAVEPARGGHLPQPRRTEYLREMTGELPRLDTGCLLVLSRRLVGTSRGAGTVAHHTLGTQCELNAAAWEVLERFRAPRTTDEVLREAPDAERAALREAVEAFFSLGFIVPAPEDVFLFEHGRALEDDALFAPRTPGFLGATDGAPGLADFCFVGVPFDRGSERSGAAEAPRALREGSAGHGMTDARTGRLLGVRDAAVGRVLLAGALVVDRGDVVLRDESGHAEAFARIEAAAREIATSEPGVLVFLGGDHAVTTPIFQGIATEPLFVVHLDAHGDASLTARGVPHHHGSFVDALRRHPHVSGVLQVGVRDYAPPWFELPPGIVQIGSRQARRMAPAEVLAHIPEGAVCYVTIDIDVLDPGEAPGTWTGLPGGLSCAYLEELLEAIGRERDVRAVDLVEFVPSRDRAELTLSTAMRLLVCHLDAIHRRRLARPSSGDIVRAQRRGG